MKTSKIYNDLNKCFNCNSKKVDIKEIECHPFLAYGECCDCNFKFKITGRVLDKSLKITYQWKSR